MKFLLRFCFLFVIVAVRGRDIPVTSRASFPTGRIVGGKDAVAHSAPYIVSLRRGFLEQHFCAGSLISRNWILTAGHCLIGLPNQVLVVAGAHDIRNDQGTQAIKADRFVQHPQYQGGVGPNDIGLIHLESALELNSNVQPVNLPEAEKVHSGDVVLYGWGSTSKTIFPSLPRYLQTVTLPLVKYSDCAAAIPNSPIHKTNVCTGPLTGGVSACSGDSGGPLVQQNNTQVELVGIVSWGYIPCGQANAPSVYTRVSAHIKWIQDNQK